MGKANAVKGQLVHPKNTWESSGFLIGPSPMLLVHEGLRDLPTRRGPLRGHQPGRARRPCLHVAVLCAGTAAAHACVDDICPMVFAA